MPLFEIIKHPERLEQQQREDAQEITLEFAPLESQTAASEVDELRALARRVDALAATEPVYEMNPLAERFLEACLEQARAACAVPYEPDPELQESLPPAHRQIGAVVLTGDWPTVVNGREAALATVAELGRRGFLNALHDYRQTDGSWRLRILFGI